MRSARQSAIRLLQLMMVASVVLPLVLFAFAAWLNYRHEYAVADDRIERSLDILHEHTLKVFQTVERAIAEVNEIVRGMSDDDIRRDQLHLHERVKHIVDALPQVRAIFLIDRDGRPLVSSQLRRIPSDFDARERSFFNVHVAGDVGTNVSDVLTPRLTGLNSLSSFSPGAGRRRTARSTAWSPSPCCRRISRSSMRSSAAAQEVFTRCSVLTADFSPVIRSGPTGVCSQAALCIR